MYMRAAWSLFIYQGLLHTLRTGFDIWNVLNMNSIFTGNSKKHKSEEKSPKEAPEGVTEVIDGLWFISSHDRRQR